MRQLIAALLAVMVATAGIAVGQSALPQHAAAAAPVVGPAPADGIIAHGVRAACVIGIVGVFDSAPGRHMCAKAGKAAEKKAKAAFTGIWTPMIGDLLKAGEACARWMIRTVLTLALLGPSLRLEDTGLFGRNATLAGMLVWFGWVIAVFALMWQLAKTALSGQMRHAGRAVVGWVQNAVLTAGGLTVMACLLRLGDTMTTGLVSRTFGSGGHAYKTIVAVMVPDALDNPVMVMCTVAVLLLVGGVQLVLIFLRQAAIPVQALLLPIAGAGRVGGDATRQWAPRLVSSILAAIAYKPLLAVIICVGFSEMGHGRGVADWLRGMATLILGVLAPGPLMKVFAPIGAEVGGGLAAGGALGAAASIGQMSARGSVGSDGSDGRAAPVPDTAAEQARRIEVNMPRASGGDGGRGGRSGQDALAQAARTQAGQVPAQPGPPGAGGAAGAAGAGTAPAAGTGAAAAGGPVGLSLAVLDGVSGAVQTGSRQIGESGT